MGMVMLAGAWRPVAEAEQLLAVLARTYKRDKDGKFSSGGGGAGADRGAAELTAADFEEGSTPSAGQTLREVVAERASRRVADRWDVTREDFDAMVAEDGPQAVEYYRGRPFAEAKQHYVDGQIVDWESRAGKPVAVLAIHAAAQAAGHKAHLLAEEQGIVDYAAARPAVQRATASLGQAMYRATQDWFAERGISAVKAKRATASPELEHDNLYTSWSLAKSSGYARRDDRHSVVHEDIPVSRVFSTPATGLGSLAESELVVFGGPSG